MKRILALSLSVLLLFFAPKTVLAETGEISGDGSEYWGFIEDGSAKGFGVMTLEGDITCIGMFESDMFHGFNLIFFPDTVWGGTFYEGDPHGINAITFLDEEGDWVRYVEEYEKGEYVANYIEPSVNEYQLTSFENEYGILYVGEVLYGTQIADGYGYLYNIETGDIHAGMFSNGLLNGLGVQYIDALECYVYGEWENGYLTYIIEYGDIEEKNIESLVWPGFEPTTKKTTEDKSVKTPSVPPAPTPTPATEKQTPKPTSGVYIPPQPTDAPKSSQEEEITNYAAFYVRYGDSKDWGEPIILPQSSFDISEAGMTQGTMGQFYYSGHIKASFGGGNLNQSLEIMLPYFVKAGEKLDSKELVKNDPVNISISFKSAYPSFNGKVSLMSTFSMTGGNRSYVYAGQLVTFGQAVKDQGWFTLTIDSIKDGVYTGTFSAGWGTGKDKIEIGNGVFQFALE